jgi:hypothetical protein
MAVRAGMSDLILRLRQSCEAGSADYTLGSTTYWSDQHIQDKLDEHRARLIDVLLVERPQYVSGENVYTRYEFPPSAWKAIENPDAATDNFRVHDSTGADVPSADFTFDARDLSITFDADTEGETYYFDGYAYDLQTAAMEIWLAKAAHIHTAINFSADGHRFDREALYKHCIEMAKAYGYREPGGGGQMKASRLVRSDLAGSEVDAF